ncbi:hypothetical protein [Pseudoduganella aquatica]|uniref:Uncharacterized protein n=1 Tax=Pseudoduganella aquatica TaxID=2660641 RepID=A0A7X4KKZ6_9BURK|nr:hypothetical protein [Pseudoduganella aquatica]MYN06568.1 hypothetical protein [Pseudoduganella aquatica]
MNKDSQQRIDNRQDADITASWMAHADMESALDKCDRILKTLPPVAAPHFEAAITLLAINLNDALQKASTDGKRITFSDNIDAEAKVADVTELISKFRNAACHIFSPLTKVDGGKFRFIVIGGKAIGAISISSWDFGSDFEDDVAIYFGRFRVYLVRHIQRAVDELNSAYPRHRWSDATAP